MLTSEIALMALISAPFHRFAGGKPIQVTSYCPSPDGSTVAIVGGDDSLHLVRVEPGGEDRRLKLPGGNLDDASFSPDGAYLATWNPNGGVRLIDVRHHEEASVIGVVGSPQRGSNLEFSRDGARLLIHGQNSSPLLWSTSRKELIRYLGADKEIVEYAVWSPDTAWIATMTIRGVVRIWDGVSGEPRLGPLQLACSANGIALDPSGKRIAVGFDDAMVRVFDVEKGTFDGARSYEDQDFFGDLEADALRYSADGRHLLTGTSWWVGSWSAEDGHEEWRSDLRYDQWKRLRVTYLPGDAIVFASRGARMIDARSGETLRELPGAESRDYSLARNGTRLFGIEEGGLIVREAKSYDTLFAITLDPQGRVVVRDTAPRVESNR